LHTRLEIAEAIRTLAGPDQDELLRQRRAEIATIRRELEALPGEIRKAGEECLALAKAELQAVLKKYSPNQPRVPVGNRDAGQWTSGSKAGVKRRARQCAMPRWKPRLATRGRTWQLAAGLPLIRTRQIPKMS
jgi:hypothetical protein